MATPKIKNSSIKKKAALAAKYHLSKQIAPLRMTDMVQLYSPVERRYSGEMDDSVWLHSKKIAKSLMNIYNEEVEDIDRFVSYIEKEKI